MLQTSVKRRLVDPAFGSATSKRRKKTLHAVITDPHRWLAEHATKAQLAMFLRRFDIAFHSAADKKSMVAAAQQHLRIPTDMGEVEECIACIFHSLQRIVEHRGRLEFDAIQRYFDMGCRHIRLSHLERATTPPSSAM